MRQIKKGLVFLLVFAMMLAQLPVLKAAENDLIKLEFSEPKENTVKLLVKSNKADVIYDGKLVISYNADVLKYKGTEVRDAFERKNDVIYAANGEQSGKVIITFADINPARVGDLFEITFDVLKAGKAVAKIEDGSYISDVEDKIMAEAEKEIGGEEEPIEPGEPIGPIYPVDPDKPVKPVKPGPAPKPIERPEEKPVEEKPVEEKPEETAPVEQPNKFIDVKDNDYFNEAVNFVSSRGYMNGVSDTMFAPNTKINRGMIVTILWRMENMPIVEASHNFVDVKPNDYFAQAVAWAYGNGITKGKTDTLFDPNGTLTREELVTFIQRYAQYKNIDTNSNYDLSKYVDSNTISNFALTPMKWAVEKGIITGTSDTTISPKGSATRAQVAIIIMRYAKLYLN